MGTGVAVVPGQLITAAKMNLKLEDVDTTDVNFDTWDLVTEVTLAAPTTTINFAGLDISTDKMYRLVLVLVNNTAISSNIAFQVNGDTTATNYYEQYLWANGVAVSAARNNENVIGYIPASSSSMFDILVTMDVDGWVAVRSNGTIGYKVNNAVQVWDDALQLKSTVANVTSITIVSAQNLKVGTKAYLFRVI